MQTWLDHYVAGALDSVQGTPLEKALQRHTDLDAMRLLAINTLTRNLDEFASGTDDSALLVFTGMVLAFCNDHNDPRTRRVLAQAMKLSDVELNAMSPRGIRVSADLVATFAHATPPKTDMWLPALFKNTWYFDIPHRAFMLNPDTEIRALFTQAAPKSRSVSVVAVLCEPGSDQMSGRYAWMLNADGTTAAARGDSGLTGIDSGVVRDAATDLLQLLLLYRQSADEAETGRIPQVTAEHLAGLKRKKAKARQKTHSLFRVVELRAPRKRFGRTVDTTSSASWILQNRVDVSGHFRWHAYGPRQALRRLQWIEPHERGPKNAPKKIDLEPLRRADDDDKKG